MVVSADPTIHIGPESSRFAHLPEIMMTSVTLSLLGVAAVYAKQYEQPNDTGEVFQELVNHAAHPVLGFSGALVTAGAVIIGNRYDNLANLSDRVQVGLMLGAATAINFAAEAIQSQAVAAPEYKNFLSEAHIDETMADYTAALMGVGLFVAIRQRASIKRGVTSIAQRKT